MKYMGSKRWMLLNGLGELLSAQGGDCNRFIDLFAGSGVVSSFVATKHKVPCHAYDLQLFSAILSGAILSRLRPLDCNAIWIEWSERARIKIERTLARKPDQPSTFVQAYVHECRAWCAVRRRKVITTCYGGHYFSPEQALWIDALRSTLPSEENEKLASLSALIQAASRCAASPGHTAQPFQPTRTAKKFIQEAWANDIQARTKEALSTVCKQFALCAGDATVLDANEAAKNLKEGDLVFLDPPYSGVHYSRFYHVLETIAQGSCSSVSGSGRYPAPEARPKSSYSIGSTAPTALNDLLATLANQKTRAILTFPSHECSNGLSGRTVKEIASRYFGIKEKIVESKFSTLGGNCRLSRTNNRREAKQKVYELILFLSPRKRAVRSKKHRST